jgi:hypothetical protein
MSSKRPILIIAGVILTLITLWQFSRYVKIGAETGFAHLVVALICLVAAMGCGIAWILTKPKESMEDISITKI